MKFELKFVPSVKQKKDPVKQSIFFMHIPKSGGTTIDHIFAKLSLILKTFDFHRIKISKDNTNKQLILSQNNKIFPKFISGHLNHDYCDQLENIYKCTIVRDPVQRVVSDYKFNIYSNKLSPKNMSFTDYVGGQISKYRDNLITRQFAGLYGVNKNINNIDYDTAVQNLNNFDNLNIFNNWNSFLSSILSEFNLPSILYSKYQSYNYNFDYSPSKNDIGLINKYFELDLDLYSKIDENKNINKQNKSDYNKNICIVSPYLKTENRLFSIEEIKKILSKIGTK
mgnify:FL=1